MKIRLAALPIAVAALVVLSGCAPGLPSLPNPVENIVEQVTGGKVDVGSNAKVPDGWPGLPLPQGELISSLNVDQTFVLTYKLVDVTAADALVAELLEKHGFVQESTADYGGLRTHILHSDGLSVAVSVLTEGEDVVLNYSSTPRG